MKTIAIGDIHGRPIWKDILGHEADADHVVFIGDYFDDKDGISSLKQINNFHDILEFRNAQPGRVHLLTGNHDYHYLPCCKEEYIGFQYDFAEIIQDLVEPARKAGILQMAFQQGEYLFTHAGITTTWAETNNVMTRWACKDLNLMFLHMPEVFAFCKGPNGSLSGNDITQPPIWVRPQSLVQDALPGYIQVVGHTQLKEIERLGSHWFIDCLGRNIQYLVVEDGEARVGSL